MAASDADAVAEEMCEAVAAGDTDAFGQLVEQNPNALYVINAEGKIPIQYAKDAKTYGDMMHKLLRCRPKTRPPPFRNPSMIAKRPRRAQPRSLRHLIRENAVHLKDVGNE